MTNDLLAYYGKRLAEVQLRILLADDDAEAREYQAKASFYRNKLEQLGQIYDPANHRFDSIDL